MQSPPIPSNEAARKHALDQQELSLAQADEALQRVVDWVSNALDVPIALVSLVDDTRQWFLARRGLEATETSREVSFCAHAVAADAELVVEDAQADERFADNPLVTSDPNIRFYAGVPLHDAEGYALGTLCGIDTRVRSLDEEKLQLLRDLAHVVEDHLALRKRLLDLNRAGGSGQHLWVAMAVQAMRAQLTKVLASAEILSEAPSMEARCQRMILGVRRSAMRISRMALDLLDLFMNEQRPLVAYPKPLNVAKLVGGMQKEFVPLLELDEIELQCDCSRAPSTLHADESLLRRMLATLIEQAAEHSSRGAEVRVQIKSTETSVQISVADEGQGLSESDFRRVFTPSLSDDQIKQSSGFGLGLALCRVAAKAQGGSIFVENLQPRGKRFILEFPLHKPQ